MPIYLDKHDFHEMSAAYVAEAHSRDLEIQDRYGVRFLTYWFDEARGSGFCLVDAPDRETAMRVHREAHGDVASVVVPKFLLAWRLPLVGISEPRTTLESYVC